MGQGVREGRLPMRMRRTRRERMMERAPARSFWFRRGRRGVGGVSVGVGGGVGCCVG